MAKIAIAKASTNVTVNIFIQDSSSSVGAGLTGLAHNSSGLTCYYVRPAAAAAQLTLATQTTTGTHSDGGFVEIDSTNMPGWYRLDLSDAILATGVDHVGVHLKGATNMAPLPLEIQLTDFDLNDDSPQVTVLDTATDAITATSIAANAITSTEIADNAITAAKIASDAITAAKIATDAIGASELAAGAVTEIQSGLATAASISALNDLGTADIDARLVAIGLDHLLSVAVTGTDITDNSIIAKLVSASASADWDDFVNTTDSLQAIRDNVYTGTPPTAAAIRTEIDSNSTQLAAIVADTNELQGDWTNDGRLDLILDARASQTTVDNIETDTQDIQGRLPATLVSGRMSSDAASISGSTTAADRLEASVLTIVSGTAQTGTLSTTVMTSDLSEATDDHYNGRIIIWTSGALQNQATDITDYSGTNGTLTYTAVTEAPSNGDTFIII